MQETDLTIYAGCLASEPIRWKSKANVVQVLLGSQEWLVPTNSQYVTDTSNRSNKHWADLCCIETLLHDLNENCNTGFVGNAQYRRSWHEDYLAPSADDTLYVPEPALFHCSLKQQFQDGHRGLRGYEMTMEAAQLGLLPLSAEEMDAVWQQNNFHGCLMARGLKLQYQKMMTMLIEEFCEPIWNRFSLELTSHSGYNQRGMAFIAERLMTAMILYRNKLNLGPIETAPIVFHDAAQ